MATKKKTTKSEKTSTQISESEDSNEKSAFTCVSEKEVIEKTGTDEEKEEPAIKIP